MVHGEEEGVDWTAPTDGVAILGESALIAALRGKHAIQVERQDDVLGGSLEVVADGVLVARVEIVELRGLFGRRGRGVVGRHLSGHLGASGGLLLGPGGSRGLGGGVG